MEDRLYYAGILPPLFIQVLHPALIGFEGPIPEGLQSISLPENFGELSPEEQLEAKKLRVASLYTSFMVSKLYRIVLRCSIAIQRFTSWSNHGPLRISL